MMMRYWLLESRKSWPSLPLKPKDSNSTQIGEWGSLWSSTKRIFYRRQRLSRERRNCSTKGYWVRVKRLRLFHLTWLRFNLKVTLQSSNLSASVLISSSRKKLTLAKEGLRRSLPSTPIKERHNLYQASWNLSYRLNRGNHWKNSNLLRIPLLLLKRKSFKKSSSMVPSKPEK